VTTWKDQAARQIADAMTAPSLTDDDRARLLAIWDAGNEPDRTTALLRAYYGDLDRAERTPRALLYLHLGLLGGMIARLLTPTSAEAIH